MDIMIATTRTALALGVMLALGACGTNTTERAATGGAGGAVAGALIGGPVGAVIGGVAGAGAGSTLDEDAGKTARDLVNGGSGQSLALSPDRVRSVQQALNDKGASLRVDGVWGRQSRQALSDFQRNQGLKVNGRLDKETSDKLGLPQDGDGAHQSGSSGDSNVQPSNADSSQLPTVAPPPVPPTTPGPMDNTMPPPPSTNQP